MSLQKNSTIPYHNARIIQLIALYQRTFSPKNEWVRAVHTSAVFSLTPGVRAGCRFWPSCSTYAQEAFARYPARRASALTARRLLRCRLGSYGGLDPIPNDRDASPTNRGHRRP